MTARPERDAASNDLPSCQFVEDGAARLAEAIRNAILPDIQKALEAEYADRLAAAGPIGRVWIRWELNREIERRVEEEVAKQMPSDDTLY